MFEKFKVDSKKEEKPKILRIMDDEQIEITKITESEVEDAHNLLLKGGFEVTESEIRNIIKDGLSFGAYVSRILIAVGLGWRAAFDTKKVLIVDGEPNSVYLEDIVVSLAYEGRGVRKILIESREKEARIQQLLYSISYVSGDLPEGDIAGYIKEKGNKLARLYLLENYEFHDTKNGILAVKVF